MWESFFLQEQSQLPLLKKLPRQKQSVAVIQNVANYQEFSGLNMDKYFSSIFKSIGIVISI